MTGGVVSSLGKGITAASLALLLKRRGLRVAMQKLDPYFNVDPGTMSPYQHGEVFVTADGTETTPGQPPEPLYVTALRDVLDCFRRGAPPPAGVRECARAAVLIDQAYALARAAAAPPAAP